MNPDQPGTWETILIRCPRCKKGMVPEIADRHVQVHYLLQIGDYITKDLTVVEARVQAEGIYAGNGQAKFFDEPRMRWVGLMKKEAK